MRHHFSAKLWRWSAHEKGSWFFVSLPEELSTKIKAGQKKRIGWGSIPVIVTIGDSSWSTSIFPSREGFYVLPVKKEMRVREDLEEGMIIDVSIVLQR